MKTHHPTSVERDSFLIGKFAIEPSLWHHGRLRLSGPLTRKESPSDMCARTANAVFVHRMIFDSEHE